MDTQITTAQPQKLTMGEILKNAMSPKVDSPLAFINLVKAAAIQEIGKPREGATTEELAVYDANVWHAVQVFLGRMVSKTHAAFRQRAWEMYQSGDWLNIRLPVTDAQTGELIRDEDGLAQYEQFVAYDDWFWRVAEDSGLDRTIATTTLTIVSRLLPEVAKGIIKAGDKPVTIKEVMSIDRSKIEVIAGPINKLFDEYSETHDTAKLNSIGGIIKDANTLTREELKKKLSAGGHRGTRVAVMTCYKVDLPDDTSVYAIKANTPQAHFLEGILSGRLEIIPTEPDELPGVVSRGSVVSYNVVTGEVVAPEE